MSRRGMVRGFVGADDRTHAIRTELDRLRIFYCGESSRRLGTETAFIANPKFPLHLGCVSAIEDEIRRKE